VNGTLVTIKVEETLAIIQNVGVLYIEVERSKNGNLHAFKIVNAERVPENMVLKKPVISKAVKMTTKHFLKHRLHF
jgi:hypothetical protein